MRDFPPVECHAETVVIPTYLPHAPDRNPMFLEKRVYQGSSGRVYPLPFTDRVAETKTDREWRAVWIENEYLRVMVLPEIGGRIHVLQDKTNGYDLVYRQSVIKPALVGLAGPWISGGIEFNWPQHHRPATFLPVDHHIERGADGSVTVWCSDHDPMERMKGMHGVCLHPGRAVLELKVRAYNRTPLVKTFLWWANVAVRVHEGYQSFFPPDVTHIADHARRATSAFPLCEGVYYGINYGRRARDGVPAGERPAHFVPPHGDLAGSPGPIPPYAPNDLSWYANIPTPCSYMAMGSREDFFGGYDHVRRAGIVHVADHRIAPGKKQWTWGNHDFGYAWDRNLTDTDGPYIELMAGVYTDNQPDFSFLQPGETKSWSQYWCPLREIGPVHHATIHAAVRLDVSRSRVEVGVNVTSAHAGATVRLRHGRRFKEWHADLSPSQPFSVAFTQPSRPWPAEGVTLVVRTAGGDELLAYAPRVRAPAPVPPAASEPSPPGKVATADELYLIGLHLEQYRHATRCPTLYWREALRRDSGDARCNTALGRWYLRRGEWVSAEEHLRAALARMTALNANPADGEAHYHLGLCLRFQADGLPAGDRAGAVYAEAGEAFAKAAWNQGWAAAAWHALAETECCQGNWTAALGHLELSLRAGADNLRARALKVMVLRRLGREEDASVLLKHTRELDPLDAWSGHLDGVSVTAEAQIWLDVAHDLARAGLHAEALDCLEARGLVGQGPDTAGALPTQSWGARPLVLYTLGWLEERRGSAGRARYWRRRAAAASSDYCFPARVEEIAALESAITANPRDARAACLLGNLFYDRRRQVEAIRLWERSARIDAKQSVVWRNLGIGYYNVLRQPARARAAYERAFKQAPRDARVLFERDQLWKRLGVAPRRRLRELQRHPRLVSSRDDLAVEQIALCNQTGDPHQALALLSSRRFQPWEGGEGLVLGEHVRTHLLLGRLALTAGDAEGAKSFFERALESPGNLGEAGHLLANRSDVRLALGDACASLGDKSGARRYWEQAAAGRGDFQEMRIRAYSEMTVYAALALGRLGRRASSRRLLEQLLKHAVWLKTKPAVLDYFATSLPTLLLFDENLDMRQTTAALYMEAQARLGLGQRGRARRLLNEVLGRNPAHAQAGDLATGHQW